MKLLLIGDVHAVPEELEDCQRLVDLALEVANAEQATPVFMGDVYHTHNIIRAEVMAFWRRTFKSLKEACGEVYCLVGNHDYAGEGSDIHALMAHEGYVTVVDQAEQVGGVLMVPYISARDTLPAIASRWFPDTNTLLCHQTFAGSIYENGFLAEDGVNPDLIPQVEIVSGHIHTPQTFGHRTPSGDIGTVTYIGAPRWRSLSDANVDRAIWVYEFNDDGSVRTTKAFDTSAVCRKLIHLIEEEGQGTELSVSFDPRHDYRIDIRGSAEFIERRKKELGAPGVRIRTFNTSTSGPALRESEGIPVAFRKYVEKYSPRFGTPTAELLALAQERLGV